MRPPPSLHAAGPALTAPADPPPRTAARRRRGEAAAILVLLLLDAAALTAGLLLPAITVTRLGLFDSPLSMAGGLGELWHDGSYTLFALILLFSVALPYCKLALLAWLVLSRHHTAPRRRLLLLIAAAGRWSMLDVLALAMVVVTLRGGFWVSASLAPGLYLFAGAVILAMLLTAWVTRRAAREERPPGR